jgi:hypothetical protein
MTLCGDDFVRLQWGRCWWKGGGKRQEDGQPGGNGVCVRVFKGCRGREGGREGVRSSLFPTALGAQKMKGGEEEVMYCTFHRLSWCFASPSLLPPSFHFSPLH